ncbi:MAG: ABC transporter ATP-binding protein [Hyphomonadaceae bacterium]
MSAPLSISGARVELGRRTVIDDVSLTLSGGEIVALLGPNGAGKTSLMRAGLGLIVMTKGVAMLGAAPAHALSARDRALRAAYLPQRPQSIWPISVEMLVALGRYAHGAAPDRLGLHDRTAVDAALDACALTALRTRRMDEISGGEKARAHLARALAQRAPLLVLDEPTAGLDPAQALAVADILRTHAEAGGAVLFSTHDIALAASVAHRVVLLKDGRIIAHGAPIEALTGDVLKQAYGRSGRLERVGDGYAAVFEPALKA